MRQWGLGDEINAIYYTLNSPLKYTLHTNPELVYSVYSTSMAIALALIENKATVYYRVTHFLLYLESCGEKT